MKKTIDENIAIKISPTKNIEAFQEKSALETSMSLIAEGNLNIPGVDDHVSFLQKLQTEIHTPAKNIELENQLKRIEAIQHEVEFSVKKTEIEKKRNNQPEADNSNRKRKGRKNECSKITLSNLRSR